MTSEGLVTPSKHRWAGKQNSSIFIYGERELVITAGAGICWGRLVTARGAHAEPEHWELVHGGLLHLSDSVKEVRDVAGGVRKGGSGSEP